MTNIKMRKTLNSMQEKKSRKQVVGVLRNRLMDSLDLYVQCKNAHWNVRGQGFMVFHELFDKIALETQEFTDIVAERMVQLGAKVPASLAIAANETRLPAYPMDLDFGDAHVYGLSHAFASYGEHTRDALIEINEIGDAVTVDILTEILRGADKYLWMLESHESGSGDTVHHSENFRGRVFSDKAATVGY